MALQNETSSPAIVWSCIARGNVILVEDGDDAFGGGVTETARQLLQLKPTPGWEFHRCRRYGRFVQGIKFHLYENKGTDDADEKKCEGMSDATQLRIWVFACVFESKLPKIQAQSYIEKLITITTLLREEDKDWKLGGELAAQRSFGPTLCQRMEEVKSLGRVAMCHERLDGIKVQIKLNIDLLLEQEERSESLDKKATHLNEVTSAFEKKRRELRRAKMLQVAKRGKMVGTAAGVGAGAYVVIAKW